MMKSRYRTILVAAVALGAVLLERHGWAQNPFDTGGAARPAEPAAATAPLRSPDNSGPVIDASLPESIRLILETVRAGNPNQPESLVKAIETTLDIEQYDSAKFYLDRLGQLALTDAALFQLYEKVGSDFFLRLRFADELAPQGRELAERVMQAVEKEAIKPERLNALIRQLSAERIEVRSAAFRELRRTGPSAVAAMLNVFADPSRRDEFVAIRNALRTMGKVAIGPLLGAADSPRAQVKYEALTALARSKDPDAFDAAAGALFSARTHEVIREALRFAFEETYGAAPQREDALQRVMARARDYAAGARPGFEVVRLDGPSPSIVIWSWNHEMGGMESVRMAPETASRLLALGRAQDLFESDPANREYRNFYLLIYLDVQKRLVGPQRLLPWGDLEVRFPGIDADELDQTITDAVRNNLIASAAGGCDLLSQAQGAVDLLRTQNVDSGLIQAFKAGDRHLQYCALRAIDRLDPQSSFFGSSYAIATAVYLAGYGDRPSALVGHNQIEISQNLAAALGQVGILGRAVSNSRDFFHEATVDSNVQFLFISDTLFRPDYLELAQQLRMDWRTKRTPIAILTSDPNPERAQRLAARDGRMLVLPLTTDRPSMNLQAERMRGLADPWPLSNEVGQLYSTFSVQWLKKVVTDADTYGFYEPMMHQDQLANLIFNPLHTEVALEILGEMGTAVAQSRLLDYASQNAAPIELRQVAARAFGQAIQKRGLLVDKETIRQQYLRYNTSHDQSGDVQRVLGSILDAIEHHALSVTASK